QNLRGTERGGSNAAHGRDVLVRVAGAVNTLVAVGVVDVILAVVALLDVRVVAVELGRSLHHGICARAQPVEIARELVAPPEVVRDLGGTAEDVVYRAVRAEAALGDRPAAVLPFAGLNPVPSAGVGVLGERELFEGFRPLLPRFAQEV